MKQLSIIIPVYNVEKYIQSCINSIFNQGVAEDSYEIIIINDGTKDHSMEMIEDIIDKHTNIHVINQKNQGLSMARNNGIKKACGEYILFLDSDDLLAEQSLSILMEHALKTKADLVVADFERMDDQEIIQLSQGHIQQKTNEVREKTGWSLLLEDLNPRECYVWRTLYRRQFLSDNHITFIPGIYYEDIPFTHECYLKAKRSIKTNIVLYIYRIGHSSITTRISKRTCMDFATAIIKTWKLSFIDNISPEVKQKLNDNVFATFSVLLYQITHNIPLMEDRRQILNYIKRSEPNMHFSHGLKQQFVSIMYRKMPFIFIETRIIFAKYIKKYIRYH